MDHVADPGEQRVARKPPGIGVNPVTTITANGYFMNRRAAFWYQAFSLYPVRPFRFITGTKTEWSRKPATIVPALAATAVHQILPTVPYQITTGSCGNTEIALFAGIA